MLKVFQTDRRIDGRADRLTDVTFKLLHFSNINNNSWDGLMGRAEVQKIQQLQHPVCGAWENMHIFLYKEIHSNLFYF